jgi:capsular polysaccharide biosynthesis protein
LANTENNNASLVYDASLNDEEVEIDLVEIFYLLWEHVVQIILCLIAGAIVAFVYSYFLIAPTYTATSKMYIVSSSSSSAINLSDLQLSSNLKADYQELMKSRTMLQDVINNLGLAETLTPQDFQKQITITNPSDTRILYLTVVDKDPTIAADKANELARQAERYLPDIMNSGKPNIYESAIIPSSKSAPSYVRNTVIGALLGALACCGYLIVRFLMNDTLVTPDDVYKYLGLQPLATIPEGNLTGKKKKGSDKSKSASKKGADKKTAAKKKK